MAMHTPMALVLNRLLGASWQPSNGTSAVETAIAKAWLADGDAQALFGFVRRLGLTDEQADDAVQEVFTRLLAEHRRGVVIANPRAWTYRSIYRLAMDQHRIRTRLRAVVGTLGHRSQRRSPDDTDRIAVWSEVDRLPLRQRQVVYLRYRSDLEYQEIGQVLGITSSAARSHAAQATATLRARLAEPVDSIEELP
jgi:RNA polymerase sigma factor (sigma-70 family)